MKNVKYMNATSNRPSSVPSEPQWQADEVPLDDVIRHGPFQVRNRLDRGAILRYQEMTAAGKEPPPIKVARVQGRLYLVDGWHRLEAGAIQTSKDLGGRVLVDVLLAEMTAEEARWEAARANMDHGVPLKSRERLGVFKAFIAAKKHRKADGKSMSYREMGQELGVSYRTIHEWTRRHFPGLYRHLGGMQGGHGGLPDVDGRPSLEEEHQQQAEKTLAVLLLHAEAMRSPEGRWRMAQELEQAAAKLREQGVSEPTPEPF